MPLAPISANTIGDTAVVAAVTGKRVVVSDVVLYNGVATANNVKFRTGTTDLYPAFPMPLATGIPISIDAPQRTGQSVLRTNAGEALNINLSAATAVGGFVVYELE